MKQTALRIASYNIRKARGLDQKRNPERTVQVINGLGADVVVLQEADKRLGVRPPALPRALIAAETDFDLVDVSANGISIGWHGNAVLVRKDQTVASVERIALPGFEPRGAVLVRLQSGLTIIAGHLGLRRKDRRAQLDVIQAATRDEAHCIIAGDFNEWSQDKGFEPLHGRFQVFSPGKSFHAKRPLAALDRFALTRHIDFTDAGVAQDRLARVASDHLPIWSDIVVHKATC